MKNSCEICPRNCKINRDKQSGFCNATHLKVAKIMKHFWEEPVISGANGSGAIFFSHCNLKCCYCQNYQISHEGIGNEISIKELADLFKQVENSGVHNINLVSPTHFTKEIIEALKIYKPKIPIVWNTSGYENVETIKLLKNYVDIFLCDFKYFDNNLANELSSANNYVEVCKNALLQMRQNQPKDIIENGIMKKGIIIRHLILPKHAKDSVKIFEWVAENLGIQTIISIMSQYIPCYKANAHPEINKTITNLEYKYVLNAVDKLNFENGYIQELSSANKDFIPCFDLSKFIEL